MNELSEHEWYELKSDFIAYVIVPVVLAGIVWVIFSAISNHQPYVNPVCRNEFGHQIDCPTGE